MQIRFGAMSPKLHEQLGLSEEETTLEESYGLGNGDLNFADPFTMLSDGFCFLERTILAMVKRQWRISHGCTNNGTA